MAKHKIASISLTVRDRAISSKFSTRRVSKKCTLGNFQKIFPSPHMVAILNFCQKTRLLDSFHRDRPKGRRGIPSWNLSLVLHQLSKVHFEPIKEASLKHLTFKTVFLLALASRKRRSEIHAWQNRNIRHQSD